MWCLQEFDKVFDKIDNKLFGRSGTDYVKLPSARISRGYESMSNQFVTKSFSTSKNKSCNCSCFVPYIATDEKFNDSVNIIDEVDRVFKKYFSSTRIKRGYHPLFLKSTTCKCNQSKENNQVSINKNNLDCDVPSTTYGSISSQSFKFNRKNVLEDVNKYYQLNYHKIPKRFANNKAIRNNSQQLSTFNILDEEALNQICGKFYSHK